MVVDDDPDVWALLETSLSRHGFESRYASSAQDALALLAEGGIDAVVTDLLMPGMDGLELCERIVSAYPGLPVIVLTVVTNLEAAVGAIRAGAWDFITKPIQVDAVVKRLKRACRERYLRTEVRRLRELVADQVPIEELRGSSSAMRNLTDLIHRVAPTEATVLISGESGTGKELVARALHRRSRRAAGPFIAINCSALPEALLESELFGHVRGAFTDARSDHPGLLGQAAGGTLFLDEVGDLPLGLQPKLLRALEERRMRPLGSNQEVPFDARIVAATNRDIQAAVEQRRFRDDLFFRLNVIHIPLPPLRARGHDILLLAQHFLVRFASRNRKAIRGFSPGAADRLLSYRWPGNVRELRNAIERAVILAGYEDIQVADLPEAIRDSRHSRLLVVGADPVEVMPLEQIEQRYVVHVLDVMGGNKTLAAKALGLDRKTLHRKLARWKVA